MTSRDGGQCAHGIPFLITAALLALLGSACRQPPTPAATPSRAPADGYAPGGLQRLPPGHQLRLQPGAAADDEPVSESDFCAGPQIKSGRARVMRLGRRAIGGSHETLRMVDVRALIAVTPRGGHAGGRDCARADLVRRWAGQRLAPRWLCHRPAAYELAA